MKKTEPTVIEMQTDESKHFDSLREKADLLKKGERVIVYITFITIALFTLKLLAGLLSGSISLIGDAIDSFSDIFVMFASWFGLRVSQRSPDRKFPYGYYRVETLISLIVSVLIFFMIQVLYAQILVDYIIQFLENQDVFFTIILIFSFGEIIALIISIIVSMIILRKVVRIQVFKAILFAFLINILFWFILSFLSLWFYYPEVFSEIVGYEIIFISPLLIVYFGIYILDNITLVWIFTQITYFILFGIFMNVFYVEKRRNPISKERRKLMEKPIEKKYRW